ncbi:putative ABC transport system ATP-binding protein [Roseimicrobium gellanilyticum]|uniref:Putative ABC transport system ATP-binding protein n=1 Tax=Roseimicrobium gellanilyticum TaxID=748857 RepID=A0A366HNR5_9BACT|nr:ABC transporter ATP-binding protein [Roseimicrobium gellanilyticum]RBP45135.1 putative ABC transport system ATP-binding protein [Roseimicrobium gellanilyticum]
MPADPTLAAQSRSSLHEQDVTAPVLAVSKASKSYGDRPILRDVTFTMRAGERVALLGPSGSGKTTLLNCIGGVDRPDSGEVLVAGCRLHALDTNGLAEVRRKHLGMVFQFFHLLPTLTAAENVELPLQLLDISTREREDRVELLLDRVGLTQRAKALPSELSGGEMQRVAIARAIVHKPALLLADEPTGNLDSQTGVAILNLLEEVVRETGAALLMVTHSEEAAARCQRILRMKDGTLTES